MIKVIHQMCKFTVLGYKKESKHENIISDLENIYHQLSNALSTMLISYLELKIDTIEKK